MSHEMFLKVLFLKVFDGLQKTFLCSPLVILIFKVRWYEQQMSKLSIKKN